MGIYTSNRYFGYDVPEYSAQIPANEAYNAAFGCAQILADCQTNDMALFESTIYSDMNEVMSIQEGYQVVNENAFTDIIKKIVEMFKKLVAKIKGIFNAFIAKIGGFAKNGKDLVKKYEKQILKYSNWKKFKIKVRRPKGNATDIISLIDENIKVSGDVPLSESTQRYIIDANGGINFEELKSSNANLKECTTEEDYDKILHDVDTEDIKEGLLALYVKDSKKYDYKDFSTELTDEIYEDEDEWDGDDDRISSSSFTTAWIKGVLMNTKLEHDADKCAKNLQKAIDIIIDSLNKTHDKLIKEIQDKDSSGYVTSNEMKFGSNSSSGKNDKNAHYIKREFDFTRSASTVDDTKTKAAYDTLSDTEKAKYKKNDSTGNYEKISNAGVKSTLIQKGIQCMQKIASNEQEVVTKITSEYMNQIKFAMAQAKKIWTSAAAYSSMEHKEHTVYYEALGECAAEQVYQSFEAIR